MNSPIANNPDMNLLDLLDDHEESSSPVLKQQQQQTDFIPSPQRTTILNPSSSSSSSPSSSSSLSTPAASLTPSSSTSPSSKKKKERSIDMDSRTRQIQSDLEFFDSFGLKSCIPFVNPGERTLYDQDVGSINSSPSHRSIVEMSNDQRLEHQNQNQNQNQNQQWQQLNHEEKTRMNLIQNQSKVINQHRQYYLSSSLSSENNSSLYQCPRELQEKCANSYKVRKSSKQQQRQQQGRSSRRRKKRNSSVSAGANRRRRQLYGRNNSKEGLTLETIEEVDIEEDDDYEEESSLYSSTDSSGSTTRNGDEDNCCINNDDEETTSGFGSQLSCSSEGTLNMHADFDAAPTSQQQSWWKRKYFFLLGQRAKKVRHTDHSSNNNNNNSDVDTTTMRSRRHHNNHNRQNVYFHAFGLVYKTVPRYLKILLMLTAFIAVGSIFWITIDSSVKKQNNNQNSSSSANQTPPQMQSVQMISAAPTPSFRSSSSSSSNSNNNSNSTTPSSVVTNTTNVVTEMLEPLFSMFSYKPSSYVIDTTSSSPSERPTTTSNPSYNPYPPPSVYPTPSPTSIAQKTFSPTFTTSSTKPSTPKPTPTPSLRPSTQNPTTLSPTQEDPIIFYVLPEITYELDRPQKLYDQIKSVPQDGEFIVHLSEFNRGSTSSPCVESVYAGVEYNIKQASFWNTTTSSINHEIDNILTSGSSSSTSSTTTYNNEISNQHQHDESETVVITKEQHQGMPIFLLPSDNDINDCPNPQEAWKYWNKYFNQFEQHFDLDFQVERQTERPENFAFAMPPNNEYILFLGLHIVGGTILDREEHNELMLDNLKWVYDNINTYNDRIRGYNNNGDGQSSSSPSLEAVVIFGHSPPLNRHSELFEALANIADMLDIPMIYIHGDSAEYSIIRNMFGSQNMARIEVTSGSDIPPLKITAKRGRNLSFKLGG